MLFEVLTSVEKKGFKIYIKEHPRLGGSGVAGAFKSAHLLSSSFPSEFIDRTAFDFEIAITSAALEASSCKVTAISLIRMLQRKTVADLGPQIKQMENINNVKLISYMEEFEKILSKCYYTI